MRKFVLKLIIYVLVTAGATLTLLPFLWMVFTSFKMPSEVEKWPPQWGSKSFLGSRDVKIAISMRSAGGVDWKGLSLREALTLVRSEGEFNVLSLKIDDDPLYRGEMTIYLPQDLSFCSHLSKEKFNSFVQQLRETTKDEELRKIIDSEISPERFFSQFLFTYTNPSQGLLERRRYISSLSETLNGGIEQLQMFERYAYRVPEEYREDYVEFIRNSRRVMTDLISAVTPYKAGVSPILEEEEITQLADILNSNLKQLSIESLPQEIAENPVVKLYSQRIFDPAERSLGIINTYQKVFSFFKSIQTEKPDIYEIKFRFPSKEERIQKIEKAFAELDLDSSVRDIVFQKLQEDSENLPERIEVYLDEDILNQFGAKISAENKRVYLSQVKQNVASLMNALANLNVDLSVLLESIDSTTDFFSLLKGFSEESQAINVILSKLRTSSSSMKESDFIEFMRTICSMISNVASIRKAYAKASSSMVVLQAPFFVKELNMKQGQNIDITLDNVDPVYLEDENYTLKASFSPVEILANIFQNYALAWKSAPFARYYLNTAFVATATTVLEVIIASMAAYAFSFMRFPARNAVFGLFLATMMIPGEVLLVPNFITVTKLGWIDTYYALIVPWIVSVFAIFLIRQHFLTLPSELRDAAYLDGCSHWRFLWTIVAPLSKPVIVTGALLKFVGSWNAFLWVLIVTNKDQYRTLPVGLQNFSSEVGTVYNQLMAAATFSILPILILFLFTQKYFIRGIARTGIK